MTVDTKTDRKGLRNFGLLLGGMVAGWFGLLLPAIFRYGWPVWPWIAGAVLVLLALAVPGVLRPLYVIWMYIGHVLGWINTRVVLSLVYFLVFTPVALWFRMLGKDPMCRRFEQTRESYRKPSTEQPRDHLKNPY